MKIHSNIPTWGSIMLCLIVLALAHAAPCQSMLDRLAYQTGIGAASRARANGMLPSSAFYDRSSKAYWQGDPQHHRIDRAFTRIRIKNLHRIFTRIKLNKIKIKIKL